MKKELDWRQILDCKTGGTLRADMAQAARQLGYTYYCHNDAVYSVETGEVVGTARDARQAKAGGQLPKPGSPPTGSLRS